MGKGYRERIKKMGQLLKGEEIKAHSRYKGAQTFRRKRKMPLEELLVCTLSKRGLTTEMELRSYAGARGGKSMQITKQGCLQQRKRLNPEVFRYLNQAYLREFYSSAGEDRTWKGYLVLAVDGSKAEVPDSPENRRSFGQCGNQHTTQGPVRAQVSSIYDTRNGFCLDMQISSISASETELAKAGIEQISQMVGERPVLLLFDRGYPSIELVDALDTAGYSYLFRLSSNDYKEERRAMERADDVVWLEHTTPRLQKIRRKYPDRFLQLQRKGRTQVRIVQDRSAGKTPLILMTNLPQAQCSCETLVHLYLERWGIEQSYHTLKNKLKLESVTGRASVYVYQDFLAQMLVYNMVQDIRHAADTQVCRRELRAGYQYPVRTNENLAIGLFKEHMIRILLENKADRRAAEMKRLQSEMERYILPRRITPGHPRKKRLSNKHCNNLKPSF